MRGPFAFAAAAVCGTAFAVQAGDVAYETRLVGGKHWHAVIVNLSSEDVKVSGVINPSTDRLRSIRTMIRESQPAAAMTGTFFDTRTGIPVGAVVVDGTRLASGSHGSCLVIDYFNEAQILDPKPGRSFDMDAYRFVLRGGVRVLNSGSASVYPRGQKFRDPRVWSSAPRSGVGLTEHSKLVMLVTRSSATLSETASAFKAFGAKNAMVLDGGGSTALYYRGELKISPQRHLSNLLVVYEEPGAAWKTYPPIAAPRILGSP
ncbi:MAG: phosphodiester glycosidase family protein [Armatimonadetes bacterium]|nr:phosphodiester glycosidase family protein [Armatimonadota bacterium]NOG92198.1 phosphodiester glycosidase family protein [Armatimonadota bacterium]